jgi:hypothetical protein
MSMSEKIEAALSPIEWQEVRELEGRQGLVYELSYIGWIATARRIPASIAILNDALPDSDPRKITRERVDLLAEIAKEYPLLQPLADALASYLPPE